MVDRKDIRSLRLSHKIRQRDLAEALSISVSELSKIERYLVTPDELILVKAAKLFKIESHRILEAHYSLINQNTIGEGYVTAIPEKNFVIPRKKQIDTSKIPIIDLFCGTGGFSHGFELTGHFEVISGLDLLPDRAKTFSENHETAITFCADIQKFQLSTLVDTVTKPQIIIGGPPCQGFSSIRPFRNLTHHDTRNNLFENFALAVDTFKPRWFVLENVVGLLTHNNGQTFKTMIRLFQEIGYQIDWKVLNAANYGLPQRRERLIVVGNSQSKIFFWPSPTHYLSSNFRSMIGRKYESFVNLPLFSQSLPPAITVMEAIHDLPEIEAGEQCSRYRDDVELTPYEILMRGGETQLTLHEATAHSSHMIEIIKHAGFNRSELPEGLTTSGFSSSYSRLEPNIPSVTLTVNFVHPASNKCIHPYQNRALTPREGARLQGFEDSYRFVGTRTQIVKQIGNAIPPILGKVIALAILEQY